MTRSSLPIRACPTQCETLNKMKKLDYKSGQYIFKAGDKGKEIFLLMSGDVGIFLPTNDTKQKCEDAGGVWTPRVKGVKKLAADGNPEGDPLPLPQKLELVWQCAKVSKDESPPHRSST